MRFNFSSPLDTCRVTGKYMEVGDGDGEDKTRPHPAPLPCLGRAILVNGGGSSPVKFQWVTKRF